MTSSWITETVGSLAAVCTTVSFLPQLIHVWRRKSAKDVSMTMLLLFVLGFGLWLFYGFRIGARPIIIGQSITLTLSLIIMALKIRYDGIKS
jgi:MtN3 and saliva related transmembrane protein